MLCKTQELKKDPEDRRDFKFSGPITESSIPRAIDHTDMMSPVKDQGSLGCHDYKTEILTEDGWMLFSDLGGNEKVATVNHTTKTIEYQTPTSHIEGDYTGDMYYFNHKKGLNCIVTPNHRMYIRQFDSKAGSLKSNYELVNAENVGWYSGLLTNLKWNGESPEFIKMPDVNIGVRHNSKRQEQSTRCGESIPTSDFIQFLGLYLAEGCCYHPDNSGSYRVEIAASDKNIRKEKVIEIVDKLPYKYTLYCDRLTIHNKSLYTFLKDLGNVYTKRVPKFVKVLSKSDIELFLDGYYLGDGSYHENGARTGYSVSKKLLDDIQELSIKIGKWSRLKSREPRISYIRGRKIESTRLQYELYERQSDTKLSITRKRNLEIIPYDNKVYCVEVPNGVIITRREGCVLVSGNSCVGFGVSALKEWHENVEHAKEVEAGKKDHRDGKQYDLSEQWIYHNCKKIDDWPGQDGTSIRYGMKVLNKIGVPVESAWGYNDVDVGKPEQWSGMISRWNKIESYRRISNIDGLVQALSVSPVPVGLAVFSEFFTAGSDGRVYDPVSTNAFYGGHCVCAVGYSLSKEIIKFKNSWGRGWGRSGYGYLSFDYIRNFMWDAWACQDISVTKDMLAGKVEDIRNQ